MSKEQKSWFLQLIEFSAVESDIDPMHMLDTFMASSINTQRTRLLFALGFIKGLTVKEAKVEEALEHYKKAVDALLKLEGVKTE